MAQLKGHGIAAASLNSANDAFANRDIVEQIARGELRLVYVAPERLMEEALALAGKLAAVDRQAMAATKQILYRVADLPFEEALEEGRAVNKRMRAFRSS